MTAVAGMGTIITGGLNDVGDDITVAAVGRGQDLGDVPDKQQNLSLSIETIIMSALIFIGILSWFEFLRTWYDQTFDNTHNYEVVYNRFWYAIFITSVVLICLYIVYRITIDDDQWDLTIQY